MENFKIKSRYLKRVQGCFKCMRAAFYRPDYQKLSVDQKTRSNICFKTCGRAFETLSRAFETLGRAFEGLR